MLKIKVNHNLIDWKDFYQQVYNHLIKTDQAFCFTSIGIIGRGQCLKIINN